MNSFWLDDSKNAQFASDFSSKLAAQVKRLFDLGMPYVFVANIYPKHIAPVTAKYLCGTSTDCVDTWGQVIKNANAAIESALKQFGDKVILYDSFGYIEHVFGMATKYGFTATDTTTVFCDGFSDAIWTDCMTNGHGSKYLWMNYVQPTTKFHWYIARNMKNQIKSHLGMYVPKSEQFP